MEFRTNLSSFKYFYQYLLIVPKEGLFEENKIYRGSHKFKINLIYKVHQLLSDQNSFIKLAKSFSFKKKDDLKGTSSATKSI